jgi:hypothetical protein
LASFKTKTKKFRILIEIICGIHPRNGEIMFQPDRYLKRALQIVWNYKVLWIFGFLLAITGGGGGGGGGGGTGGSSGYRGNFPTNPNDFRDFGNFGQYSPQMDKVAQWFETNVAPLFATEAKAITTTFIIIGILVGIAIIFGLIAAVIRYPAETAVMRMVNEHEQTGSKLRFKEGWKLGWNGRAWRIFLVDLLIGTPAFAVFVLLIGGLAAYMISNGTRMAALFTPGVWIWIAIVVFLMMALAFVMLVASLVRQYIVRKIAFEAVGVWEGFRQGWTIFKQNLKHTILTWLIMIGIGIAFGFAMILVAIILVPAYAVLLIPGAIAAAVPGAIGYAITSLFAGPVLPWIIGAFLAIPVLFMVVFSPLMLVSGAYTVFSSNVWTLLYRDKIAEGSVPPVPQLETPPSLPAE